MSNLTNSLISAAMEPTIQDLYEEDPQTIEDQVRNDAISEVTTIIEPDEPEKKELTLIKKNTDNEGYFNPNMRQRHRSAEAELQDRLLTIPTRPSLSVAPWGSLWVIHTGFIEQIALLNITKSEQRGLLRQWADIQVLAEGDGNEDIVEAEQDEFMLKIVSYKSRSDNPERGVRERTAHITNKTITDQTVQVPKSETQKSGFLNTILGRKINNG